MTTRAGIPHAAEIRDYTTRVLIARAAYDPDVPACTVIGRPRTRAIGPRKPASVRAAAVKAYLAGEPQRSIAARVGVSQGSISDWVIAARKAAER